MSSLLSTLASSLLSGSNTDTLASKTGASSDQVTTLVNSALPLLLQSMANNASDEKGAKALDSALDSHADKSASVSDLLENADTEDGSKIIGHLLGDKTEKVEGTLAKSTGLSSSQVGSLLASLAPAVMNMVGTEKKKATEAKENSSADLSSTLIGLVTGKSDSGRSSGGGLDLGAILSFAQKDNDGDGKSDILSALSKLITGK